MYFVLVYNNNVVIFNIFLSGLVILFVAIVLNGVAQALGLQTWYDFIQDRQTTLVNAVWLFVLYPFSLGVVWYILKKIISE